MGYKDSTDARFLFKGQIVTDEAIDDSADIDGSKLDSGSIEELEIGPGVITNTEIATNAGIVGTKLAAKTVTYDRIADNTITESQVTAKALTHASLSDTAGVLGSQLGAGTLHSVKGTVTWNGGATQAIATLPAGALLLNAISVCNVQFNGTSPTVTVGYTASQAVIITSCTLTTAAVTGETYSTLGTDLFSTVKKVKYYAAQTVVNGYLAVTGSPSAGSLDVYLVYIQTA
jgi:hypothetical protein